MQSNIFDLPYTVSASGATKGEANGQLPIPSRDLPIEFFINKLCLLKFYFFRIVYLCLNQIVNVFFFFRLNHEQGYLKLVNRRVDFFDSDSDSDYNPEKFFSEFRLRNFFCDLWAYKQQRLDFKDSFGDSDVENFSQLVHILVFALSISIKFSLNYSGQISTAINCCIKKYLTRLVGAVLRLHFIVYKQS